VTNLTINTGGNFTANPASTINIGAGTLTIGFDENGLGATADLSGATITAGSTRVIGGAGNDTFITGAGAEAIVGGGGVDTAFCAGTRAQYTISPEGQAVLVTKGGVTDTLSGISFLHFSDQTIPAPPPPTTPAGTTADLILQETMGANTGQLLDFDLGNNSILAGYPLGSIGLSFQLMGLGAFAGNPMKPI
jgi:RTX calcium-binding nonapeptide repeat (4 copies)